MTSCASRSAAASVTGGGAPARAAGPRDAPVVDDAEPVAATVQALLVAARRQRIPTATRANRVLARRPPVPDTSHSSPPLFGTRAYAGPSARADRGPSR